MKSSYRTFTLSKAYRFGDIPQYKYYMLDKNVWYETRWCLGDETEASIYLRKLTSRAKRLSMLQNSHILRGWL